MQQYPSSTQEELINADLNGFLLTTLFLGVYTVVYFGTLYLYLTKKASQHWVVLCIISMLYLVYVVQTTIQWYQLKRAVVNNGKTQDTVFTALFFNTTWVTFVDDVGNFIMAALADVLLIWRCFVIWNHSVRVISLPSFFLFYEIVVYLCVIVLWCATDLNPSLSQGQTITTLLGVSYFMTLASTVSATLLISYRIHSFFKQDLPRGSKSRFRHIIEVLVQSAAVYSFVALAIAISSVIPYTSSNATPLFVVQSYLWPFYIFVAGAAPTIMVARVVSATDTNESISATTPLSGLLFHGHSNAPNSTQSLMDTENGGGQILQKPGKLDLKE